MIRIKDIKYNLILICFGIFLIGGNALSVTVLGTTVRVGEIAIIFLAFVMLKFAIKCHMPIALRLMVIWGIYDVFLILVNTLRYGFSASQCIVSLFYLFRFLLLIFVAYYSAMYVKKQQKIFSALGFINLCYLIICVIGFYQLVFYPVAYKWYALFEKIGNINFDEADPHVDRLVSTYFDPNYLSCCLLLGVAVDMYLIYSTKKRRLLRCAILIVYIIAILLSKSRSGMLGSAILIVAHLVLSIGSEKHKLRNLIILCLIVISGVILVCFSDIAVFVRMRNVLSDDSAGARFNSWDKGWNIIKKTYGFGIGYNLFGAYNNRFYGANVTSGGYSSGLDSSVLLIVITSGILGAMLLLIHFILLFKQNKNTLIRALMFALFVVCWFNNLLFYSLWILPFYFLCFSFEFNGKGISDNRNMVSIEQENKE